jgi:hypothetical protein
MATKPSGGTARQQRHDHTDDGERRDREHQKQTMEALHLNHQDRRHDEEHERNDGHDRRLALGALLHGAADPHRIASRQLLEESGKSQAPEANSLARRSASRPRAD